MAGLLDELGITAPHLAGNSLGGWVALDLAARRPVASAPGFDAAFRATVNRRFLATAPASAPVTVAFGSRDLLLRRHQSRHLDQLPPGTKAETLPGCGHVPMADDPAVAALIIRSAAEVHPEDATSVALKAGAAARSGWPER